MTLALPRSTEENGKLLAFMVSELWGIKPFWIGATDAGKENYFVDSEGTPITYSSFAAGEPNNSENEDCVEMAGYPNVGPYILGWNDQDCADMRYFACESKNESVFKILKKYSRSNH